MCTGCRRRGEAGGLCCPAVHSNAARRSVVGQRQRKASMNPGKPSRTAIATAAARAAHLHIYATAHIHADDFALKLIGNLDPAQLREAVQRWRTPSPARMCAYFALRQRYSEDKLQQAVERGVRQAILLGAGLDSLALRRPALAQEITLVEVEERAFSAAAADESATLGEPWLTYFDPAELEEHLVELGFNAIERLTPQLAVSRYYASQPADVTPVETWQAVSARV